MNIAHVLGGGSAFLIDSSVPMTDDGEDGDNEHHYFILRITNAPEHGNSREEVQETYNALASAVQRCSSVARAWWRNCHAVQHPSLDIEQLWAKTAPLPPTTTLSACFSLPPLIRVVGSPASGKEDSFSFHFLYDFCQEFARHAAGGQKRFSLWDSYIATMCGVVFDSKEDSSDRPSPHTLAGYISRAQAASSSADEAKRENSVASWTEEHLWRLLNSLLSALAVLHSAGFHYAGNLRAEDVTCFCMSATVFPQLCDTYDSIKTGTASVTDRAVSDEDISLLMRTGISSIIVPQASVHSRTPCHRACFVLTTPPHSIDARQEDMESPSALVEYQRQDVACVGRILLSVIEAQQRAGGADHAFSSELLFLIQRMVMAEQPGEGDTSASEPVPTAVHFTQLQALRLRVQMWLYKCLAEENETACQHALRLSSQPRSSPSKVPADGADMEESVARSRTAAAVERETHAKERAVREREEQLDRREHELRKREEQLRTRQQQLDALLELYELTYEHLDALPDPGNATNGRGYAELRRQLEQAGGGGVSPDRVPAAGVAEEEVSHAAQAQRPITDVQRVQKPVAVPATTSGGLDLHAPPAATPPRAEPHGDGWSLLQLGISPLEHNTDTSALPSAVDDDLLAQEEENGAQRRRGGTETTRGVAATAEAAPAVHLSPPPVVRSSSTAADSLGASPHLFSGTRRPPPPPPPAPVSPPSQTSTPKRHGSADEDTGRSPAALSTPPSSSLSRWRSYTRSQGTSTMSPHEGGAHTPPQQPQRSPRPLQQEQYQQQQQRGRGQDEPSVNSFTPTRPPLPSLGKEDWMSQQSTYSSILMHAVSGTSPRTGQPVSRALGFHGAGAAASQRSPAAPQSANTQSSSPYPIPASLSPIERDGMGPVTMMMESTRSARKRASSRHAAEDRSPSNDSVRSSSRRAPTMTDENWSTQQHEALEALRQSFHATGAGRSTNSAPRSARTTPQKSALSPAAAETAMVLSPRDNAKERSPFTLSTSPRTEITAAGATTAATVALGSLPAKTGAASTTPNRATYWKDVVELSPTSSSRTPLGNADDAKTPSARAAADTSTRPGSARGDGDDTTRTTKESPSHGATASHLSTAPAPVSPRRRAAASQASLRWRPDTVALRPPSASSSTTTTKATAAPPFASGAVATSAKASSTARAFSTRVGGTRSAAAVAGTSSSTKSGSSTARRPPFNAFGSAAAVPALPRALSARSGPGKTLTGSTSARRPAPSTTPELSPHRQPASFTTNAVHTHRDPTTGPSRLSGTAGVAATPATTGPGAGMSPRATHTARVTAISGGTAPSRSAHTAEVHGGLPSSATAAPTASSSFSPTGDTAARDLLKRLRNNVALMS